MKQKISIHQFNEMLHDPSTPEADIRPYLLADMARSGPFVPIFRPNPELVELPAEPEPGLESAMHIGNGLARWRRQRRFRRRLASGEDLPVLISEGDSWFQFPFLIDDVIDHLGRDHLIYSLGAAGDTAANMILGNPEFKVAFHEFGDVADAFLLSAAGNDIIGEDTTGEPVLRHLLKAAPAGSEPATHINFDEVAKRLDFLRTAYQRVVTDIRANPKLGDLPIFIHGYDYAIPGSRDDPRRPVYAAPDEWLGGPMREAGIVDPGTQRGIIRILIDGLYDMMQALAETPANRGLFVVDIRGTLPDRTDWADEIHGTSDGFRRVADKFKHQIEAALTTRQGVPVG